MLLGKLVKQPVERQNYFVKYADYLQEGEVLVNIVGVATLQGTIIDPLVVDNFTLIGPVIMASNQDVEFWLEGGLDGMSYKLEFTATTNFSNVKQDEFKVKIKEI
mgnify:CR=1 FL=1